MKTPLRIAVLALCAIGLNACYIVQPVPGTSVVIQQPTSNR